MEKQCLSSSDGYHAIRMSPEEVAKYIEEELLKGRKGPEVLKEVQDCQYCKYCGKPIW